MRGERDIPLRALGVWGGGSAGRGRGVWGGGGGGRGLVPGGNPRHKPANGEGSEEQRQPSLPGGRLGKVTSLKPYFLALYFPFLPQEWS